MFESIVLPDLDTFMGPPYEDICRQYLIDNWQRLLGWQPLRVGRYWDARTEIDLIAVDAAGELLIHAEPAVRDDHDEVRVLLGADVGNQIARFLFRSCVYASTILGKPGFTLTPIAA